MINYNIYYSWFEGFYKTLRWIQREYKISNFSLAEASQLNYSLMCKKFNLKGSLTIADYLQIKYALISLNVPKNVVSLLDKSSTILLKNM